MDRATRGEAWGRVRIEARCSGTEHWWFAVEDEQLRRRLLSLGAAGIGGFEPLSSKEAEAHHGLCRRLPSTCFDPWRWTDPPSIEERLELVLALTRALIRCEDASIFPGPLHPRNIAVERSSLRVVLRADVLVADLVGAPVPVPPDPASRWIPPEQAEGAIWDHRANRYVAALLAYRALTDRPAFGERGLRLGREDQAQRGAPPFPDEVAERLLPGVQTAVLQALAPDLERRPQSARAWLDALERRDASPVSRPRPSVRTPAAESNRPSPPRSRVAASRRLDTLRSLTFVGAPLLVASVASTLFPEQTPREPVVQHVPGDPTRPTTSFESADDCAGCHPQHVTQWHESVMAHSIRSPLFSALEILIEEQVGKSFDCPGGAGVLRHTDGIGACRDSATGLAITGSGGEGWCINCHSPKANLSPRIPAWNGTSFDARSRRPLPDLVDTSTLQGIDCVFCHRVEGPASVDAELRGDYEGNPDWVSFVTGQRWSMRPEDRFGRAGIANSAYRLGRGIVPGHDDPAARLVPGGAHRRLDPETSSYLESSEFCGSCHDVRLFGTDAIGGPARGEHFKRLRNAYSEWREWAADRRTAGRPVATCQDCHMSEYPGVCEPGEGTLEGGASALARACPPGTYFEPRPPGSRTELPVAVGGGGDASFSAHYFTGVDLPLADDYPGSVADDPSLDPAGIPASARRRRDLLLGSTFSFDVERAGRRGDILEIPVVLENIGAGHKVPAGFSQEREIWVHLRVTDGAGRLVYEVGRVDAPDEDLHDKQFLAITVDDSRTDAQGRPLGVFGANVADGPDRPEWSPPPGSGATAFVGRGLINLQNGFLRCVRCIGRIDARGKCQPLPGQTGHRAARYEDGTYDLDTGACESNLVGTERFLEIYFPVGSLDASRGVFKGPDAILDTRAAPPEVPLRYVYRIESGPSPGPFRVEARLLFRAFPPFLVRAFAQYEALQAERGLRPSGPLVSFEMLERLEVVELHAVEVEVP